MTDNFAIWKPEHDGHAPPNWRDEMQRYYSTDGGKVLYRVTPRSAFDIWYQDNIYFVTAEALNSPNDDASVEYKERQLAHILEDLRQCSPELLAKHGITLAPERDWATELWAETFEVFGKHHEAARVRNGALDEKTLAAIQLLRTRFEQMKGEG